MKLEITQDKLVDILMHAATREDIAKLDTKVDTQANRLDAKIESLDAKIDAQANRLDAKIESLDAKIDAQANRLDAKIDAQANRLDAKIEQLGARLNGMTRLIITGILIPLVLFAVQKMHYI